VVADIKAMGCKATALQLDMSQLSAYDVFFNTLGSSLKESFGTATFDYLINNAGIGATVPIAQVTEDLFDNMMNIHFKGVYFFTQKALTMMNDGGSIINLSSGTTRFCVPGYSV